VTLTVQHVRLGNADDQDGVLVYDENVLVAVLARLTPKHGVLSGRWLLECGFGVKLDGDDVFVDLPTACSWIEERMTRRDP